MAENPTHAKLDPVSFGLAIGLPWALGVLFLAFAAGQFDWGTPVVELLQSAYLGYAASIPGALIGVVWGLADGFIFGVIVAWIYNWLTRARSG